MTQATIPTPQRPWGTSVAQRLTTAAILALAAVLAGAAIELTGLSGKLGFAAAYFFFASLLIFVQQLRLRDLAAAKDSLLSSFAFLAMTITLIPIVSIVMTVFLKGYKGIHFGMFANDMTQASVNDPVTSGGLLHALVGTILMVGGAMLGLGRAMGETVAVYTVLNVVYQINWQTLFGAGGNVASLILLKFGEAGPEEVNALMAAGLVLFLLTLTVNAISDVLINRFGKKGR